MALRSTVCHCHRLGPGPLAVLASFFIFFMSLGNVSSFVILYVYLQKDFKASAIETGWVGSTAWAVMNFLVPLPSALYARYGCQRVVLAGVLMAFVGLLATSFATHLWMIYITYGLVFGAGSNFVLTATINLVTAYYPGKNNIRATSFASAGQPVGLLVISASLERACFYLGWRNGIRIVSGVMLAIGMFCIALSRQPPDNCTQDQDLDSKPSTSGHDAECSEKKCNGVTPTATEAHSPAMHRITWFKDRLFTNNHYQHVPIENGTEEGASHSNSRLSQRARHDFTQSSCELDRESKSHHTDTKIERDQRLTSSLINLKVNPSENFSDQSEARTDSDVAEDTPFTTPLESKCCESEPEACHIIKSNSPITGDNPTFLSRYMRLLRLPGHWFFFGGIIGSSLAALFNVIHFVSFASTIHIEEPTSSWMLLLMSAMEIVARVLVFFFGNRTQISKNIIFAIVCVMGALATYGIVVSPTFPVVTCYITILGFVRGTLYAIAYGATVDTFGVDTALESYTSLLLSYGIAGALVSTVGISKDMTGEFTISLHMIAALFLLSAILFICAHVWRKLSPLIGLEAQRPCDVNANECKEEKHVVNLENGIVSNGVAVATQL